MPYRIEEAKTARAGCKNKECQESKVKIGKGELRFGTWVETRDYQSWHWRHWGCVTPKVIENLSEGLDGDFDLLDGYDEISSENQEKVKEAVEQGHVADSDWKGDVEVNRPGKTGFRVRASKKAKAESKSDEEEEKPQKKKPGKARKAAAASDGEEEETAPKKAKASSKKSKAAKSTAEAEEGDGPSKADSNQPARSKKRKVADDDSPKQDEGEEEGGAPKSATKKSKSGRKSTKAAAAVPENDEADKNGKTEDNPRRTRSSRRISARKKSD